MVDASSTGADEREPEPGLAAGPEPDLGQPEPADAGAAAEAESDVGASVEPADAGAAAEAESADDAGAATGADSAGGAEALDLAGVRAERDAYLEDLQRVTAEFTNFRRQTVKRNTELVSQAASRLAAALLPVLDACEAAVSQGVEGMEAVHAQLLGLLSAEGLAVLGSVDEPFDPGFHEAVMSEQTDEGDEVGPVVVEVLRTGYAWNGRVLRPAMVRVRT